MYDIKFKLKVMDVAKKKFIAAAAAAREFGVKHLYSNNVVFDEYMSMPIILTFLSSALTQLFANK